MNYKTPCVVCGSKDWRELGKRQYKITDAHWESGYPKIQKFVFFNIWHPDKKQVSQERYVCVNCGFVSDFPRPNSEEIAQKYNYLSKVERNLGSLKDKSKKTLRMEKEQSLCIFKKTLKISKKKPTELEILDFGGGDGHFLIPMKKKGSRVHLVDYNRYPVEGVVRLGNTLGNISPEKHKFDLIMARHVFEHLACPKKTLLKFKDYLKEGGLVYIEVPVQLFRSFKPNVDPVTHSNYFQIKSLEILLGEAGYRVLSSKEELSSYHGRGMLTDKVFAVTGNPGPLREEQYQESYRMSMSYIYPSVFRIFWKRVKYFIRFPGALFKIMKSKLFEK